MNGGRRGGAYLWVCFESFVQLPVEQADLSFVLCDASVRCPTRRLGLTKTSLYQEFRVVIKYPVVVIKIDDKIRSLDQPLA